VSTLHLEGCAGTSCARSAVNSHTHTFTANFGMVLFGCHVSGIPALDVSPRAIFFDGVISSSFSHLNAWYAYGLQHGRGGWEETSREKAYTLRCASPLRRNFAVAAEAPTRRKHLRERLSSSSKHAVQRAAGRCDSISSATHGCA